MAAAPISGYIKSLQRRSGHKYFSEYHPLGSGATLTPITSRSSLTRLRVQHQNIGSRPEQLLEVFVVADFLYERRHLHGLRQRQQPHLVKRAHEHNFNHTQTCERD